MRKLLIKLLRDIKKSKGQFIAITLVIVVGAFFSTGLATLSNSLNDYTTSYYKENNLSDLYVYYSEISADDLALFDDIEGIEKVEGRYTFLGTNTIDDFRTTLNIHTIPDNNEINKSTLLEGSLPSKSDEIIIDSLYAKENGYQVGDTLEVHVNYNNFVFTISGLCENVEHAYNIKDPMLVIPNHKTHGVAYMGEENITKMFGDFKYNELMVDVKKGYSTETIGKIIENKSYDLFYLYQVSKERTISYSTIITSIEANGIMSKVLPMIFFIVAGVTTFLTMSRMIDSERTQIGIMKALGVKNYHIIFHYMGYAILAGLIGSIIGSIVGFFIFIQIGNMQLAQMYSLPNFSLTVDVLTMIPPIIISSIFGVVAAYLSVKRILNERAAQAMRPKPPKKMKKTFVEKLSIWKRLSYGNKIIIRNIFLNKQRALFTSIGVVICVILLIIAFGYKTSMDYVGDVQLNDVYKYDLRVDYKGTINDDTELPTSVNDYFTLRELPVELIRFDEKKDTALIVTDKDNDLMNHFDEDNNKILLNDEGVVISKSYADAYNFSIGDKVELKFISPDLKGKSVHMNVSGISVQYTGQAIYCTPAYLENFDIDYLPTTLLVKTDELKVTYNYFNNNELVSKITDKEDLTQSINNALEQSTPVIVLFILCAIILSSAAIYTISSINIFERSRELATLKVLGYQKNKINKLVFIENMMITTFSILIAVPLGIVVYKGFTKSLSTVNQTIPNTLNLTTIILSVTLTILVTVISNILLRKKVTKIDMIESLKSVE